MNITETLRGIDPTNHRQFRQTTPADPQLLAIMDTNRKSVQARATNHSKAWRWAAIPAVAAAAIALPIMLPTSQHNPIVPPANAMLASWRALPSALSATELLNAETVCLSRLTGLGDSPFNTPLASDPVSGTPLISELRGNWGFVAWADPVVGLETYQIATCLVWLEENVADVVAWNINFASGLISTGRDNIDRVLGTQGIGGVPNLAVQEVFLSDGGSLSAAVGKLTPGVTALTVHTQNGEDITATVSDGWFMAWWPENFGDGEPVASPEAMRPSEGDTAAFHEWGTSKGLPCLAEAEDADGNTICVAFDTSGVGELSPLPLAGAFSATVTETFADGSSVSRDLIPTADVAPCPWDEQLTALDRGCRPGR
ncbi:MAG: hypothetical protein LBB58_06785 [Cellulomonadaceae bacterium]|jgi:hypothetical protein|nr:hypothetical protein [Cellulomonadaceae bacterium]